MDGRWHVINIKKLPIKYYGAFFEKNAK